MAIKREFEKICRRFDDVMSFIECEHLETMREGSEIYCKRAHYNLTHGITIQWMLDEAEYWLSCYYEEGNVRCDDRTEGPEGYKTWRSETGRLKRLITALKKFKNRNVCVENL